MSQWCATLLIHAAGVVMSDAGAIEAESIVRDLADVDPGVASDHACFFCGAGDPVDRPIVHADDCLHLRATRWAERRWERDEGWRDDALRRLEAVQEQLRQGRQASREDLERSLASLEAGIERG
jgi:hypothetical protein